MSRSLEYIDITFTIYRRDLEAEEDAYQKALKKYKEDLKKYKEELEVYNKELEEYEKWRKNE